MGLARTGVIDAPESAGAGGVDALGAPSDVGVPAGLLRAAVSGWAMRAPSGRSRPVLLELLAFNLSAASAAFSPLAASFSSLAKRTWMLVAALAASACWRGLPCAASWAAAGAGSTPASHANSSGWACTSFPTFSGSTSAPSKDSAVDSTPSIGDSADSSAASFAFPRRATSGKALAKSAGSAGTSFLGLSLSWIGLPTFPARGMVC